MEILSRSLLIGLVSVLLLNIVAAQNCMDPNAIANKCFEEAGINLSDPEYKISIEPGTNTNYFESMMTERPQAFCGVKEKSKKAVRCLMDSAKKCLPSAMRSIFPSHDKMDDSLDMICKHEKEIDLQCVQTKALELFNCGRKEATRYVKEHGQLSDVQEITCLAYKLNPLCQKKVLKSCGCNTVKVYTQISYDILYPENCPELSENRVKCSPINARSFLDDGLGDGSGVATVWVPSLFMAIVLVIVTSRLY